jgi:hypothetical protein
LKELFGIIKPAVQAGRHISITWTAEDDAAIVRMRTDGDSFTKIASELGGGLTNSDIKKQVDSSPEIQTAVNVIFQ